VGRESEDKHVYCMIPQNDPKEEKGKSALVLFGPCTWPLEDGCLGPRGMSTNGLSCFRILCMLLIFLPTLTFCFIHALV
jgi:hypothetical protein